MDDKMLDIILENKLNYLEGKIIETVLFYKKRGKKADLQQIKQLVDFLIELEYPNSTQQVSTPRKVPINE